MTDTQLAIIVGPVAVLLATALGAFLNNVFKKSQWQRDQQEEHREHIRDSYADWVGALLKFTHAQARLLQLNASFQADPEVLASLPNDTKAAVAGTMGEMTMATLDAAAEEEVSFARVLLLDPDSSRTKDAQALRSPVIALYQTGGSAIEVLKRFEPFAKQQAEGLTKLLGRVRDSLLPK